MIQEMTINQKIVTAELSEKESQLECKLLELDRLKEDNKRLNTMYSESKVPKKINLVDTHTQTEDVSDLILYEAILFIMYVLIETTIVFNQK